MFCLETVLERIKHSYNTRFVKKSLIDEENNIINILSQRIWLNFNIKRTFFIFFLLKNIVIMVSFLLMISCLKKNNLCHNRVYM